MAALGLALLAAVGLGFQALPAKTLYVSPHGRDSDSGEAPAKPLATIQKALDLIKGRPGSIVRVLAGEHRVAKPLILGAEHSGTPGKPTRIEAWGTGEPIIKGSLLLAGWRDVGSGFWMAKVPGATVPTELFVKGERRVRPTWPNGGYLTIKEPWAGPDPKLKDRFVLEPADLPKGWTSWAGVEAVAVHNWSISRIPIASVNEASGRVVLAGPTWHPELADLKAGGYVRFDNAPLSAMKPGEWRFEPLSRMISYKPRPGEKLVGFIAEVPISEGLLEVRGDVAGGKQPSNIAISGLTFSHSAWRLPEKGQSIYQAEVTLPAALTVLNGDSVVIEKCLVAGVAGYGIELGEGCRNVKVKNCDLVDLGAGGIKVGPIGHGEESESRFHAIGCSIEDTTIAHGGRLHPAGVGVWIGNASQTTVARCTISDLYYSGISVGWKWGGGWSAAHHNTIKDCVISSLGHGVLSDMAGIYTLGESPGTTLTGNVIHDVRRSYYGAWGIYFDEGSRYIEAKNNLVYRTQDAPFHIHYGRDDLVQNNVFALGEEAQMQFSNMAKTGRITLKDNIFYWAKSRVFAAEPDEEIDFSGNTYWQSGDPTKAVFAGGVGFEEWRRRDKGSRIANPGFVNPEKGDFRVKGTAPFVIPVEKPRPLSGRAAAHPVPPATFPALPKAAPGKSSSVTSVLGGSFNGWRAIHSGQDLAPRLTSEDGEPALELAEAGNGEDWMPHIYLESPALPKGVTSTFRLKLDRGAKAVVEWRDVEPWYTSGPIVELSGSGTGSVSGQSFGFPPGGWVTVVISWDGSSRSAQVQVGGKRLEAPLSSGFKKLGWFGVTSVGEKGSRIWVRKPGIPSGS